MSENVNKKQDTNCNPIWIMRSDGKLYIKVLLEVSRNCKTIYFCTLIGSGIAALETMKTKLAMTSNIWQKIPCILKTVSPHVNINFILNNSFFLASEVLLCTVNMKVHLNSY